MSKPTPPGGYIKIYRKAFDPIHGDRFWLKPRTFSEWEAWEFCIMLARYAPDDYHTERGVVALDRGEFVASLRWLAGRWKWSVKKVRHWVKICVEDGRLSLPSRGQDGASLGAQVGTVYRIVKYETYQGEGTPGGTGEGTARAQQGHKRKKGKKENTDLGADAPSNIERFPKAVCDAGWEAWVATMGSVDYGRFRKELLPIYQASGEHPTADDLVNSIEAFDEARQSDKPQFRNKYTVGMWAGNLPNYVRLGRMRYVDEWGILTERGIAAGIGQEQAA